jgi:hypothetical protein
MLLLKALTLGLVLPTESQHPDLARPNRLWLQIKDHDIDMTPKTVPHQFLRISRISKISIKIRFKFNFQIRHG